MTQQRRIVFTRPSAEQVQPWMQAVQEAGYDSCNVPLIAVEPNQQVQSQLQTAVDELLSKTNVDANVDAIEAGQVVASASNRAGHMFVSASAVRALATLLDADTWRALFKHPCHYWLAAGAGTVRALSQVAADLGESEALWKERVVVPSHASQFDSEHLWEQIVQRGLGDTMRSMWVYRGQDVNMQSQPSAQQFSRDWLADTARAHGMVVDVWAVYQRRLPRGVQLPSDSDKVVWVWSSSLALANWQQARTMAGVQHSPRGVAVCTHARIAQRAKDAGFSAVYTCHPEPQSLLQVLQRIK